jgi:hypothetical protein
MRSRIGLPPGPRNVDVSIVAVELLGADGCGSISAESKSSGSCHRSNGAGGSRSDERRSRTERRRRRRRRGMRRRRGRLLC